MIQLFMILDSCVILAFIFDLLLRKKIPNAQTRHYRSLVVFQILTMVTNAISLVLNENFQSVSREILYFVNISYGVTYIIRAFCFFSYWLTLFDLPTKVRRHFELFAVLPMLFEIGFFIASLDGPLTTFIIDSEGYRPGPGIIFYFVQSYLYKIVAIFLLFFQRKKFSNFQIGFFSLHLGLLIVGTFLRLSEPRNIGMGMIGVIAILLSNLVFENPDRTLYEGTKMFKVSTLDKVLNQFTENKGVSKQIFGFSLHKFDDYQEIYGREQIMNGVKEIGEYLNKAFPKYQVYYNEGRFMLLHKKPMDFYSMRFRITNRFNQGWESDGARIYFTPVFVAIDDISFFESGHQVLTAAKSVLTQREKEFGNYALEILDSELETVMENWEIEALLENILRENRLEMFLQPIINHDEILVGAEALIRMRDGEGGYISPDRFINLSEKNGTINIIGEWIFREACLFFKENHKKLNLKWINVNLSPVQCLDPELPKKFISIVNEIGVDPNHIHLEITESELVDRNKLSRLMNKMHKQGFIFALDDFGSGYNSLLRIEELPFSIIKIDKEVIWNYFKCKSSVLEEVLSGFRRLGYRITAEGVETREMVEGLKKLNVTWFQGFYYSAPIPTEAFVKKYSKNK